MNTSFDEQTLKDLEFSTIREWLTGYAVGQTSASRLAVLTPSNRFDEITKELNRVNEFFMLRSEGENFPSLDFDELLTEIKLLPIRNAVLSQEGFYRISRASILVNTIIYFFDKREKEYPLLAEILKEAYYSTEIIDAIDKVFDRKGAIKDDASPILFQIRQEIKTVRNQINKNFDKELRRLTKDNLLGDTREAFVNERRVLTVMSTHKRKVSGTVVGSSKTGSLTFIEPICNVELNNEYELLLDDERKEIYRILQILTRDIAHLLPLINEYQKILTEFDFINAKTKLALDLKCSLPAIQSETTLELINAVHPILWKNNQLHGKKTFSQYLYMDKFSRMLVISGPNAGGKSITLKTIGLLQIMLQAGLLVPVDSNSKMCFFQQVLTDIGDNQSIENELSTYSYRLKRMNYFLQVANRKTLLLLDEFGTGSDPELGGALAEVFFENLYNKKCYGVITTHYANIKLKADQLRNAINGCMLFDTDTLEPLYKFSLGQPGSSFTFEVAQINGIPMEIIEDAKSRMDDRKVRMDKLLNELQREKTYLEHLNKEHIEAQETAQKAKNEYLEKKSKLEEKLKSLQEVNEINNKFISSGKKMVSFIQRYVSKSRKKEVNKPLLDEITKYIAVEKSKIEEHLRIEKLKSEANIPKKNTKKKKVILEKDEYQREKITIGSTVKLIATKQSGTVEEINGQLITVVFGFMRMKVEREKLMWVK
ncbi:MAG: DNA mismatch repair protein MutS [Flavobacteriia bacterium]|nr:DNA mismatch repair protein MutS [Flavobacteriia bacterium]